MSTTSTYPIIGTLSGTQYETDLKSNSVNFPNIALLTAQDLYTAANNTTPASGFLLLKDSNGNNPLQMAILYGNLNAFTAIVDKLIQVVSGKIVALMDLNVIFSILSSVNNNGLNVLSMICDPTNAKAASIKRDVQLPTKTAVYYTENDSFFRGINMILDVLTEPQILALLSEKNKYAKKQVPLIMPSGWDVPAPTKEISGLTAMQMLSFYIMTFNPVAESTFFFAIIALRLQYNDFLCLVDEINYNTSTIKDWIKKYPAYKNKVQNLNIPFLLLDLLKAAKNSTAPNIYNNGTTSTILSLTSLAIASITGIAFIFMHSIGY